MTDHMFAGIEYKANAGQVNLDQAQGIVECFVAGIGNKDSVGDVCASGAFTKSLMRRKPRVVWGHNWNDPIGKVIEIYEVPPSDPRLPSKMRSAGIGGLYAKVQFNLSSEKGREAFANVAFFGEEQEWSIGYKTLRAQFDPSVQANILYEVELYEVSPVLHGANQLTGTISVKADETSSVAVMTPMEMPNDEPAEDEIIKKLEDELTQRLGTKVKVGSASNGVVSFMRTDQTGAMGNYKCRYHMGHDGVFMFGRPERVMPTPMPMQRPMGPGMPSRPMAQPSSGAPVVVPQLVPGATPSSPPIIRVNYEGNNTVPAGDKPKLDSEEQALADALLKIVEKYGKFNEDSEGVWAGYKPAAENPIAKIGVKCANCVMYQGDGKCKIIAMDVEPEGKCRFAVIPEGVVVASPIKKAILDNQEAEEEVKWVEDIEAKYPGEFISGVFRNAVRKRRRRRMKRKNLFDISSVEEVMSTIIDDQYSESPAFFMSVQNENLFDIKQLIDPILEYHMVESVADDGGIIFTGNVTPEFAKAVGAAVSANFSNHPRERGGI